MMEEEYVILFQEYNHMENALPSWNLQEKCILEFTIDYKEMNGIE